MNENIKSDSMSVYMVTLRPQFLHDVAARVKTTQMYLSKSYVSLVISIELIISCAAIIVGNYCQHLEQHLHYSLGPRPSHKRVGRNLWEGLGPKANLH